MSTPGGSSLRRKSSRVSSRLRQNNSKGLRSAYHSTKKNDLPKLSDQEWNAEIEKFRISLQDAKSSDATVQAAWTQLRESYRSAFNAVANPNGRNEDLEPFPFWAAENIEEDVLERVLRIEFSSELATCLLPRMRSIASMSDLSMYILILYFGKSFFVKGRLPSFQKRVHIFKRSTSNRWPFTEGYKRMLCNAASKRKEAVDTTEIPARGILPLFTESFLSVLAPEIPEFERRAEMKEKKAARSKKTGLTGIPMSKKNLQNSAQSSSNSAVGLDPVKDDCDSVKKPTQDSNDNAQLPLQRSTQSEEHDALTSPEANCTSHQHRWARNSDSVLPSIESDSLTSEASKSAKLKKPSSSPSLPKLLTPISESTTHSHGQKCKSSSRKRPFKEEYEHLIEDSPPKRIATANSKADLLLQSRDWDDETIMVIMKRLAASRPNDFIILSCLEAGPRQISQKFEKQQILLIPFKLGNGQLILAVVTLIPVSDIGQAGKQGYIQFLNPACSKEEENEEFSRIAVEFLQLLVRILPGYDSNTEKWHFQQNHHCPNQLVDENGGLAICLAAMSIVGGPLKAPLAMQTDWMFWRHIILSSFFTEDASVQLRTKAYLKERVERQVRRGQDMVNNRLRPYIPDYGMFVSRQHVLSPQDFLRQRMAHAESLLQIAKEAFHILNNLTDYVYDARISANIDLDMAQLQRHEQQSRPMKKGEPVLDCLAKTSQLSKGQRAQSPGLQEMDDSIKCLNSRLEEVYDLHQCLKKGRDLISHFRRDIADAVANR